MKRAGFVRTAVLGSILGIAASVSAQQQEDREKSAAPPPAAHEDQATPPQQVNPADEKRQQEAKPSQEEKRAQQDDKKVQQEPKQDEKGQRQDQKDSKQAQEQQKRQQKDDQRAQKEDKNNPQARPMQDAAHRGGGHAGARIPDDKFRAHFGREHHFRVSHPTVVSGQPRFEYGGYSFVIVDAWPAGWAYEDDCYIDYVDGEYLLFDLIHPGMSIVVTVVL